MAYTSGTPVPSVPVSWTDIPLLSDITPVKRTHLMEMRIALEYLDGHYHVFNAIDSTDEKPGVSVTWAEPIITTDETWNKASHTQEVINYLIDFDGHYHTVTFPGYGDADSTPFSPGFTFEDNPIQADVMWIKATAHNELRSHLEDMATHYHEACCECECQCTCTCTCNCDCTCTCECRCYPEL